MKKFLFGLALAAFAALTIAPVTAAEILPNGYLDLVQSGTAANRPTTPNVSPSGQFFVFYLATDTGTLYAWNPATPAWITAVAAGAAPVNKTALFTASAVSASFTLDAVAGFTATLPAATGSGIALTFVVKTTLTSGAYVIAAAGSDTIGGTLIAAKTTTATPYYATPGTTATITLTQATVGAGIKGDRIVLQDVGAGLWEVKGNTWVSGTVATPFS